MLRIQGASEYYRNNLCEDIDTTSLNDSDDDSDTDLENSSVLSSVGAHSLLVAAI